VIKSGRVKYDRFVACMGNMRNRYRILNREPEGKRPLRRPGHRWEDVIMDLK
jgi:hypothetical protein